MYLAIAMYRRFVTAGDGAQLYIAAMKVRLDYFVAGRFVGMPWVCLSWQSTVLVLRAR
jgi:hypothetical protein